MKNVKVLVSVTTQYKVNGTWKDSMIIKEDWTLEEVEKNFTEKNIKDFDRANKQKITYEYKNIGYVPTKYIATERESGLFRLVYTFKYTTA